MPEIQPEKRILRFSIFEADLGTRELRKNGLRIRLQDQPFQVLALLLQRPGELVTREEIVKTLWPADTFVDFDHSLNTSINKLREVLNDSASTPRFIETLPKRGYRFLGDVASVGGNAGVAPVAPAASLPEAEPASKDELPQASRGSVRTLFILAQVMYLGFYIGALANMDEIHEILTRFFGTLATIASGTVFVTAMIGIPLRFFLLTATSFDYAGFRAKYDRIFVAVLVLDVLWGLAPLLVAHHIGFGLALAVSAMLLYLPFGQRTLVHMAYR